MWLNRQLLRWINITSNFNMNCIDLNSPHCSFPLCCAVSLVLCCLVWSNAFSCCVVLPAPWCVDLCRVADCNCSLPSEPGMSLHVGGRLQTLKKQILFLAQTWLFFIREPVSMETSNYLCFKNISCHGTRGWRERTKVGRCCVSVWNIERFDNGIRFPSTAFLL